MKLDYNFLTLNPFNLLYQGPINREMRHLISTLQTHNQQLKGEVVKYKLRLRETQAELNKVSHTEVKTGSDLVVSITCGSNETRRIFAIDPKILLKTPEFSCRSVPQREAASFSRSRAQRWT